MKKIYLSGKLGKGKFALVDNEDFERLNRYKWSYDGTRYASKHLHKDKNIYKKISMHRFIMSTPEGMETDHINGNGLDNRRTNLRICTTSQNKYNYPKPKCSKNNYKGVTYEKDRKKWKASIKLERKSYNLGRYNSEKEAAQAYNSKAKEIFGEFANLNII